MAKPGKELEELGVQDQLDSLEQIRTILFGQQVRALQEHLGRLQAEMAQANQALHERIQGLEDKHSRKIEQNADEFRIEVQRLESAIDKLRLDKTDRSALADYLSRVAEQLRKDSRG
jgi:uncharacterized membrane protein YccC